MRSAVIAKSVEQVRADLKAFKPRYKRDWHGWMNTLASHPLVAPETVAQCRRILAKWQAVPGRFALAVGRRKPPLPGSIFEWRTGKWHG